MEKLNAAQQIMSTLGVPVSQTFKQAHGNKNASATKDGSGRFHRAGHQKSSPLKSKGAPSGFVLHTNPTKKDRRDLIALHGRRQYLRMLKEHRVMHKAANDERTDALSTRHNEPLEVA